MILYHGSNTEIVEIDLSKCYKYKDFGQAFYLTLDKEQALVVADAKVSIFGGYPVLNAFEFEEHLLFDGMLSYRSFDKYDEEWADFIYRHRDEKQVPPYMHDYDVVFGPIANDRVGMQVRNFREGNIDLAELLKRLEYMKGVTFQYAFCTEKAIRYLKKINL